MEPSQDITGDDLGVAKDVPDKDILKVSGQTDDLQEALETLVDDDGEILIAYKLSSLQCFSVLV